MGGADEFPHAPVLTQETIAALSPQDGKRYLDGTVGGGGHAAQILEASGPNGRLLGLDADSHALIIAHAALARFGSRAILIEANFTQLEITAAAHGFIPAHGVLLDLGLSSMQLSDPARGFSFASGTLDMRMNQSEGTTADDLVNGLAQDELADLIFQYGEERLSRRIARGIGTSTTNSQRTRVGKRCRKGSRSTRASSSCNKDLPGTSNRGQPRTGES